MAIEVKKRFFSILTSFLVIGLLSSCIENEAQNTRSAFEQAGHSDGESGSEAGSGNGGSGAIPSGDNVLDGGQIDADSGLTEIRHIVDPFDGTYKTKVTIPKNFEGLLYLSGLNITSLSDKIVRVRFRLGRDLEPVVVPATVGRAPGITPQTDIEVLILDMNDRPFKNVRLLYDLFDYNQYFDSNGVLIKEEPVTNPRDGGLFCRGLRLEHDPTFQGSANNSICNQQNEKCLYSYAKIRDSGLYDIANDRFLMPTEPQIDISGNGYSNEPVSIALKKCLPDNLDRNNFEDFVGAFVPSNPSSLGYLTLVEVGGRDYYYRGPYRAYNVSSWDIRDDAIVGPYGIYEEAITPISFPHYGRGYQSKMFPRVGTLNLSANTEHFSSSGPFGPRSLSALLTSGETDYVDGCNLRMMNFDEISNEGISSCNVTAKIEILARSKNEDNFRVMTSSIDVKLQIIRASQTDFEGKEVLYTSMKTCSSSSACGSGECCFNQRCWSRNLVSQCLEDAEVVGHRGIGQSCSSDFECASLCCDSSIGSCQVHINTSEEQKLCSKSPGQSCISKEFCSKQNVTHWFIVRTGLDANGQQLCALRSYNIPTQGDCRNGVCIPPAPPAIPIFDPDDPDCSQAIDPPVF